MRLTGYKCIIFLVQLPSEARCFTFCDRRSVEAQVGLRPFAGVFANKLPMEYLNKTQREWRFGQAALIYVVTFWISHQVASYWARKAEKWRFGCFWGTLSLLWPQTGAQGPFQGSKVLAHCTVQPSSKGTLLHTGAFLSECINTVLKSVCPVGSLSRGVQNWVQIFARMMSLPYEFWKVTSWK